MRIKSRFIKLFKKVVKYDKSLEIFHNGEDNYYAELIENSIENSVTASRSAEIVSDFITGRGFGDDFNKVVVHEKKGTTLFQFLQDISKSIADHRGICIHINYNANYDIKDMDVIPFPHCRVGKKDDDNYNGKIAVCKDWQKSDLARKATMIDVFNPDKEIIKYQVKKAGDIRKYKGQILYFHYGKYIYPLSPFHPVINDMQSEAQASIFKHTSLFQGFFGKSLIVTKPMVDSTLKGIDDEAYQDQVTERDNFKVTMQKFIGAQGSGGLMHVEMEFESDKIEDEFLFKQLETNIDDKLFAFTEGSVASNICAASKVPEILIRQKDNVLFSSSGEALRQAKIFVQEQTEKDRLNAELIINKLLSRFVDPLEKLNIIPLIEEENETDNEE